VAPQKVTPILPFAFGGTNGMFGAVDKVVACPGVPSQAPKWDRKPTLLALCCEASLPELLFTMLPRDCDDLVESDEGPLAYDPVNPINLFGLPFALSGLAMTS